LRENVRRKLRGADQREDESQFQFHLFGL
jgi:hypothetical protein